MASRKIADAHVQFGTKGLDQLIAEVNKAGKTVAGMVANANLPSSFSSNIAKMAELNRHFRTAIALKKELDRTAAPAGSQSIRAGAANISAGLAADRKNAANSAGHASRTAISGRGVEAMAVSPSLKRATQQAVAAGIAEAGRDKRSLSASVAASGTLSSAFKAKTAGISSINTSSKSPSWQLDIEADKVDSILKSISAFGRAGTKTAKETNEFRKSAEKLANDLRSAAQATRDLDAATAAGRGMTPEKRGQIRGDIRDQELAGKRTEDVLNRQAGREDRSVDPSILMGRRINEIMDPKTQAGMTPGGTSAEISMAAEEIAVVMRAAARDIRESGINTAIEKLARDLESNAITKDQFQAGVKKGQLRKVGQGEAQKEIDSLNFASSTGSSEGVAIIEAEADALKARSVEIDKNINSNTSLTAADKDRLTEEKKLVDLAHREATNKKQITELLEQEHTKVRGLTAAKADLLLIEEKNGKLTRIQNNERKDIDKQLTISAKRIEHLGGALQGHNANMHKAAGSSRRFNFMMQQASYGVQDFVQVIGQTGLSGALRASANNMASLAAATGTVGGAVTGALGTIAMIGFAQALEATGGKAETTAQKLEKLFKVISRFSDIKRGAMDFSTGLVSDRLGEGRHGMAAGMASRDKATAEVIDTDQAERELRAVIDQIGADFTSGFSGFWRDLLQNTEEMARIDSGNLADPVRDLAAAKITGSTDYEKIKSRALEDANMAVLTDIDKEGAIKRFKKLESDINTIENTEVSDTQGMAELAKLVGISAEELKTAMDKYKELISAQEVATTQAKQSLEKLSASLGKLETDVSETSVFSNTSVSEATGGLQEMLAEFATRIRKAKVSLEDDPDNKFRQEMLASEQAHYDEILGSLGRIRSNFSLAAEESSGISGKMAAIADTLVKGRAAFARSLEFATPQEAARQMASFDAENSARGSRLTLVEVMSFSGNVERLFGESQQQARTREFNRLGEIIRKAQQSGDPNDNSTIAANRAAQRRIMATGLRDPTNTGFENKRQDWEEKLNIAQGDFAGNNNAAALNEVIDEVIASMQNMAMAFNGQAEMKFGENQKQANDRMRANLAAGVANNTMDPQAAAEMNRKMDEFEADFMKVGKDRSGVAGGFGGRMNKWAEDRKKREETMGFDAQFNEQNLATTMLDMDDMAVSFSGAVQRNLGETQEEANIREKKRLDDLIAKATQSTDVEDDQLIPYLEYSKRKIDDAGKRDLQADTGVTPIESLHSTIQASLHEDTKDFDLQVEQKDIMEKINENTKQMAEFFAGGKFNNSLTIQ